MESSEDDAGAAPNASRRASAREKNTGGSEDSTADSKMLQESVEAAASIETASMSEEGFDADSVSSPSTQDVNTSTEAILDMIDEIVDGPSASKRLSLTSVDEDKEPACPDPGQPTDDATSDPPQLNELATQTIQQDTLSSAISAKSEDLLQETVDVNIDNTLHASVTQSVSLQIVSEESVPSMECLLPGPPPMEVNLEITSNTVQLEYNLQSCAGQTNEQFNSGVQSVQQDQSQQIEHSAYHDKSIEVGESSCSKILTEGESISDNLALEQTNSNKGSLKPDSEAAESTSDSASCTKREVPRNISSNIPSSSSVTQMNQNISLCSVNQTCERTIKCVTSSDSRDNEVTIESAESTSSDSNLCEERTVSGDTSTRSPLKRRLVRPAPSERRPDSTVSSTVDSQCANITATQQITSENAAKDVSSSSDSVALACGNKRPQEVQIQNEISVCKAEPSMNLPKKIKLIRPRAPTTTVQKECLSALSSITSENEQCQSTSEAVPCAMLDSDPVKSNFISTEECRNELVSEHSQSDIISDNVKSCSSQVDSFATGPSEDVLKVPPIKLNLSLSVESTENKLDCQETNAEGEGSSTDTQDTSDCSKQVPKLTIKLGNKQSEDMKSPIPKLTIKPIRPPREKEESSKSNEQIPNVTKINIKPIPKPAENIYDTHRKSSSSEISESESSENDESNSTSDPASNSDQCSEIVPKVTIKVGKPGTESEGKFYTEQNIPKLLIKGIHTSENDEQEASKLKLVVSQTEDEQHEKIPKLTIKTLTRSDGQPLSPKLTIKPLKIDPHKKEIPSEQVDVNQTSKKSPDELSSNVELKENTHVPKITIKPVLKMDADQISKVPKKSSATISDSQENFPVVTKLNIKPIIKPNDCDTSDLEHIAVVPKLHIKPIVKPDSGESSQMPESCLPVVSKLNIKPVLRPADSDKSEIAESIPIISKLNIKPIIKPNENVNASDENKDIVPVVSKITIKPLIKPKDNSESESGIKDIPKVSKLNIKPLRNPEEKSLVTNDCDSYTNTDIEENNMPIVTKLNIKPILKHSDEDTSKDSENQSSETGNSSDDNGDHIPMVTKINIKPIIKPNETENIQGSAPGEDAIPIVTKLNIKPLVKPDQCKSPLSPKRDSLKITKLNIRPVVKPEELDQQKSKMDIEESSKNPPLVMKINMKTVSSEIDSKDCTSNDESINKVNNLKDTEGKNPDNLEESLPKLPRLNIKPVLNPMNTDEEKRISAEKAQSLVNCKPTHSNIETTDTNCISDDVCHDTAKSFSESKSSVIITKSPKHSPHKRETKELLSDNQTSIAKIEYQVSSKPQSSLQNCTLLKMLLETRKDGLDKRLDDNPPTANHSTKSEINTSNEIPKCELFQSTNLNSDIPDYDKQKPNPINDLNEEIRETKTLSAEEMYNESITKPLEISVSDKINSPNSGQDSPRIILKINKTDHGASAKIITEEIKRPVTPQNDLVENAQEVVNDSQKKIVNRKKTVINMPSVPVGKRLRSSRIVENTEISPVKRNTIKRATEPDPSPLPAKDSELSVLESKRLKLGQLLSSKSLSNPPVPAKLSQLSPTKTNLEGKQGGKLNHTILNNENCSKNGNSKLHNILSNLQAKQAQALALNENAHSERTSTAGEVDSSTSTGSSDIVEVIPAESSHPEVQQMLINENAESHDFPPAPSDDASQDPLEVTAPPVEDSTESTAPPIVAVDTTPQPKKRGRPRKLPISEPARPVTLPKPALEERPQRSLRLSREQPRQPTILTRGRGRGRGRGGRRIDPESTASPAPEKTTATVGTSMAAPAEEVDPTSSRVKLPRMTEALDKMPSATGTPLSSRRVSDEEAMSLDLEPKVVLSMLSVPTETPLRGRGSRGGGRGRGGGRTPRSARYGRGRGGGRGAMYMKETLGIYGRVCGPATTTVQLFEEETCMMDDNATPAKPSHLLDEDSQSSVKSSTNDSSRTRKSKFDLFDSSKVWTAADVKEYMWPPPETPDVEHQVMMIQEQVAMFLGVKSFKRRYPELKRRAIAAAERDYVLDKGLVSEPLCELGITAVDASEVLDIMLSDYPHKYEEYRAHQRKRQLSEQVEPEKPEAKPERVEVKPEPKPESKPEPPKVDLEKTRQEALAAAVASASEWNSRLNAMRSPACVDLQTHCVLRPRRQGATNIPPPTHVAPPAGFYPHALLPGQYQHSYRVYTPQQLRYFPLNTVMCAPPAPGVTSDSDSDPEWRSSSSSDDSANERSQAKRKKLSKRARPGGGGATSTSSAPTTATNITDSKSDRVEETCCVCRLRLEANRKYTHERFLVCAACSANYHPWCVNLSADTVRAARTYSWHCATCKPCSVCGVTPPANTATPSGNTATPTGNNTTPTGNTATPTGNTANTSGTTANPSGSAAPLAVSSLLCCGLCDRGFHTACLGITDLPQGRWHCTRCAVCRSCGARTASGLSGTSTTGTPTTTTTGTPGTPGEEPRWHHQTRRGPGGHKVYSHSLCTPCARAYRIGRYCPLCERSFIGPKGTMQLVICKLCDRQHHQECVKQTVQQLNVLDYTCGECRRGGITSRAAAVRLAPRTIATLFMAKRRFNKYAHRQYLQSRQRSPKGTAAASDNSNDLPEPDDNDDPEPELEPAAVESEGVAVESESVAVESESVAVESDGVAVEPAAVDAVEPACDEAAAAVAALAMHFPN